MEIQAVDFDALCLESVAQADFANVNSLTGKKSFVKQLSGGLYYIFLQDKHRPLKMLLSEKSLLVHQDYKLVKKIEQWKDKQLVNSTYDILGMLGFDYLERIELQLETMEKALEELEERILERPKKEQQAQIMYLHRQAINLKKQLNDYLAVFVRCKQATQLWEELILSTQAGLDNARQLIELMENLREAYQAAVDNKLNDIMKVLTVLATILLPINLLTSFFGMNFENMPLIHTGYGIYLLYFCFGLFIICSVVYFRRKHWI